MLKNVTVALILSTTLLTSSVPMPSLNKAKKLIVENGEQKNEVKFKSNEEILNHITEEVKKKKEENEARIKAQKEQEETKKRTKIQEGRKETFVLTYYGSTVNECGNGKGITASGKRVSDGMVASPSILKFGTRISINDNVYTVEDRGNPTFIHVNNDGSIRLDVYVPREAGESDYQYEKRVNKMGTQRIEGYIL